ncbi:MAG: hypothetical protein V3V30_08725 [Parvularculaceae bacterium]
MAHDTTTADANMTQDDQPRDLLNGDLKLEAKFFSSPFALAAAVVLLGQLFFLSNAVLMEQVVNLPMLFPLSGLAAIFLTIGIWPEWNYLELTEEGIEQHAGLTRVVKPWRKVQNVRVFPNWVEIRHVDGTKAGLKKVRTARLFNRYGINAEEFGDMIDARWRRARGIEF